MKQLIPLILLILFFGCQDDDFDSINVSDDPSITSRNGTWKVIAYEDIDQGKLIKWGDRFSQVISQSDLRLTINTTCLKVYNESEQFSAIFE